MEDTRRRILQAAFDLAADRLVTDITLDAVATAAGVSVQTVLRQFGSRTGLLDATTEHAATVVAEERRPASGDPTEAIVLLMDHYERRGDVTVLMLAQEAADPAIGRIVQRGRALHRAWVEETFRAALDQATEADRARLTDLLAVATDVYTWKQLRRDQGLGRAATQTRINDLVDALLAAALHRKDP